MRFHSIHNSKNLEDIRWFETVARYFGLIIVVVSLLAPMKSNNLLGNSDSSSFGCSPGIFGNISSQKPFTLFTTPQGVVLPLYSTHDVNSYNPKIKKAYIIQHGYNREANDVFCTAYDALYNLSVGYDDSFGDEAPLNWEETIVVAPQVVAPTFCNFFPLLHFL